MSSVENFATNCYVITAYMEGKTREELIELLKEHAPFKSLQGPTVEPVYQLGQDSEQPKSFAISMTIPQSSLMETVTALRAIGCLRITAVAASNFEL